jgi:hypothetical protein
MVVRLMTEPESWPNVEDADAPPGFDDGPAPDHNASADFVSDDPPKPEKNGFSGFASRSATKPKRKAPPQAIRTLIPNRKGQFIEPLTQLYGILGTAVLMFDPVCGSAIIQSAPKCAETLDNWAHQNETVRRVIWAVTQTSVAGAVFVAHMPIIIAVSMHHIPAAQQAFGQMGADMMEEFLKHVPTAEGPDSQ